MKKKSQKYLNQGQKRPKQPCETMHKHITAGHRRRITQPKPKVGHNPRSQARRDASPATGHQVAQARPRPNQASAQPDTHLAAAL